jgi:hypothetical protein
VIVRSASRAIQVPNCWNPLSIVSCLPAGQATRRGCRRQLQTAG